MNLCFFYDADHPAPYNTVNRNHRKVISYRGRAGQGNTWDEEGHGTHTTGSLSAKALTSPQSDFNGMAPDAKVKGCICFRQSRP